MGVLKSGTTVGGSLVLTDALHNSTGNPHTQYKLITDLVAEYYNKTSVDALLAQNSIDDTAANAGYAAAAAQSASDAQDSADASALSASQSATSASNSATSASEAATSEANTAAAEANVISLYDQFDDRYLGDKVSDPALDNDGNPLLTGALYFNTTNTEMRVYNGSAWQTYFTATQLLEQIKTVDGAGSGLDADTVDGKTTTTSTTDTTTGRLLSVGDFGLGGTTGGSVDQDWASIGSSGFTSFISSATNGPSGATVVQGIKVRSGSGVATNFAGRNDQFWSQTVGSPWRELLHDGNTGSSVTYDVTISDTDSTANRLLKVGDFGVGGISVPIAETNLNLYPEGSIGVLTPGTNTLTNSPISNTYRATVSTLGSSNYKVQYLSQRLPTGGEPRVWVRYYSVLDTSWGSWREVYNAGSIIGTVSQSGGIPTGAIIERGSNANGEYVKYADGTLICIGTDVGSPSVTTIAGAYGSSAGTLYYDNVTITLPATFVDTNYQLVAKSVDRGLVELVFSKTTSSVGVQTRYNTNSSTVPFGYIAVGRWY